jgi:hypothetical protein
VQSICRRDLNHCRGIRGDKVDDAERREGGAATRRGRRFQDHTRSPYARPAGGPTRPGRILQRTLDETLERINLGRRLPHIPIEPIAAVVAGIRIQRHARRRVEASSVPIALPPYRIASHFIHVSRILLGVGGVGGKSAFLNQGSISFDVLTPSIIRWKIPCGIAPR